MREAGYDPDSWWPTPQRGAPAAGGGGGGGTSGLSGGDLPMGQLEMPSDLLAGDLNLGAGDSNLGAVVYGGNEAPVSSTHMALNAWVTAKRTRDFDEADRIREATAAPMHVCVYITCIWVCVCMYV